jgi:photosystem II stability/assembly factor-like uncharacterized protein
VNGPVDFHALTVSPARPDTIYGWYQGALQKSKDGGVSWEVISNTNFVAVALAASLHYENMLFAASPQGLFISKDGGKNFERIAEGYVSAAAVDSSDDVLVFTEAQGLIRIDKTGIVKNKIGENFSGEVPLYFAFSKKVPSTVYLLTERNSIYKSNDKGDTWEKIR